MENEEYIIHASNRGFWCDDRKGYTLNPDKAGLYNEDDAIDICGDGGRKEKMYLPNGKWFKDRKKAYLKTKAHNIQNAMEGLTSDQLISMLPELIFERRERNG